MIVVYTTEDYFHWAEIFLKSFVNHNNTEKIWLNSINLTEKQILTLKMLYSNLIIDNKFVSIADFSKKHDVSIEDIKKSKNNCISKKTNGTHRLWMNITADGDRIEKLYETVINNPKEKYFLHMDIDMLFRKNICQYLNKLTGDVGIKLRLCKNIPNDQINKCDLNLNSKNKGGLINISTVYIKNNPNGIFFLKNWKDCVVNTKMKNKNGVKWGQFACEMAFMMSKQKTHFFRFENEIFSPYLLNTAPVWFFKTKNKENDYKIALNELYKNN